VADSPYYISGTDCLKNLLGTTDKDKLAKFEDRVTARRIAKLKENPLPGKLDYSYFKAIHKNLFDGIYEWAGKERNIQTEKGVYRFEWPDKIESSANKLFGELAKENNLEGLKRDEFIKRAAYYYAELNVVHPFPEGNGRAQRTLFDQVASRAGYEFDWGKVSKEKFIEGVIHASYGFEHSKLEAVFDQTLSDRDKGVELSRSTEIDLSVKNPIEKSEYDKAKNVVSDQSMTVEKELYPTELDKKTLDEIKTVAVNKEVNKRVPNAVKTVKTYEAHKQLNTLVSQLKVIDRDLSSAKESGDTKNEKRLLKKKSTVLNKLINRKSIAGKLSPVQKSHLKLEKSNTTKSLSLHRSRSLER